MDPITIGGFIIIGVGIAWFFTVILATLVNGSTRESNIVKNE